MEIDKAETTVVSPTVSHVDDVPDDGHQSKPETIGQEMRMAKSKNETARLEARIVELERVVTGLHAMVESTARTWQTVSEAEWLQGSGVQVIAESEAKHIRALAAEYGDRAKAVAL